jgi:hypothetical protein
MKIEEQLHIASLGAGKPIHLVDIGAVERNTAERNRKRDQEHPSKPDTREYDRLVQKHFDLKQNTRHFENLVNEAAGQLKLCEERIKQTKKLLNGCESPLGQRNYDGALRRMETTELVDCKNKLARERKNNTDAIAVLRRFEAEFLPRIEELRKQVTKK